jgi:hypothetical protein
MYLLNKYVLGDKTVILANTDSRVFIRPTLYKIYIILNACIVDSNTLSIVILHLKKATNNKNILQKVECLEIIQLA